MQIKKKLQLHAVVSVLTALLICLMLFLLMQRTSRAMEVATLADQIIVSLFERSTFREDYLRTGSERAKVQWFDRHTQLGRLLQDAGERFKETERRKKIVAELSRNHEMSGKIFSAIVKHREKTGTATDSAVLSQEVENRLLTQLNLRVYDDTLHAGKLQEVSKGLMFASIRQTGGGIAAILAIVIAAVLISSWSMSRIITKRIRRMSDGAAVIGGGDLTHRISMPGDDEFAELAEAFNAMTARLGGSYLELRQQEERLRLAMDAAQMASWDWHVQSGDVVWNDTNYRMLGYEPGEVSPSYQAWVDRVHPDDREAAQSANRQCMGEKRLYTAEFRTLWPDGTIRWLEARGDFEYDAKSQPLRNYGVMLDITERKRIEEGMRRAKETAESATSAKSQFLANMSHELRTPMTGVLGMLELTLGTSLDENQRNLLGTAQSSAYSLLRILNDILDLSKIEAGKVIISKEPFILPACVAAANELLLPEAQRKGLQLDCIVAEEQPIVIGDQLRLKQILINLVGNAVKFTDAGTVTVHVAAGETTAAGQREFTISVTDTGIGIPQEKHHLLFESFSQVDDSHTRRFGGTGLGLVICKKLVELMGGEIFFTSEAGKGSTFTFTLPLEVVGAEKTASAVIAPPSPEMSPPSPPPEKQQRLLFAEDNPMVRDVLKELFRGTKYAADFADDGQLAVEMWKEGGYDLVLMDLQMPRLNGFEATRAIREKEQERGGHIPIIALTANAFEEDIERCFAAGMDDYLSKPIDFNKCLQMIEKFLAQA